jgi:tetratricopeptide (TPR) repeat protein
MSAGAASGAVAVALLARAREAIGAGRYRRAVQLCDGGLNSRPEADVVAELRLARARALAGDGDWASAVVDCRRALERGGETITARALLGEYLRQAGDPADAIVELEAALAAGADAATCWQSYALALSGQGHHAAAVTAADRARQHDGGAAIAKTVVQVLAAAGRHQQVIRFIEGEIGDLPRDADLWTALGLSFNALGRSVDAVAALRAAIAVDPGRVEANCGLGMALLRLGELTDGLRYNEHRQKDAGNWRRFGIAPWRGEPLDRAHLLVLSEQGFGDTIQFARFLPAVRRLAREVTFQVPPPLAALFRGNPALGTIATGHPGFGTADVQTLVMSLPHWLGTQSGGFGVASLPLLLPEADRLRRWRATLPTGPKIAIAWQGNPRYAGEPWRSMPLARFTPLFEQTGGRATWISVQKYFGRDQLAASPFAARVLDLGDQIDLDGAAFVDSLAVLSLVDLFVTTDSALAHLAGSAGIRTWLLLSQAADWRWEIGGESSSWYPSLRLFRQAAGGDWQDVIRRVGAALDPLAEVLGGGQPARQSGSKSGAECCMPPQVVRAGA